MTSHHIDSTARLRFITQSVLLLLYDLKVCIMQELLYFCALRSFVLHVVVIIIYVFVIHSVSILICLIVLSFASCHWPTITRMLHLVILIVLYCNILISILSFLDYFVSINHCLGFWWVLIIILLIIIYLFIIIQIISSIFLNFTYYMILLFHKIQILINVRQQ